jgi:P63C domain
MSNSIVPKLTREELIALFRKEAKIKANGSVEFSRKGLARLIGISKPALLKLLAKIQEGNICKSEYLEKHTGQSFEGGNFFDDFVYDLLCYYSEATDKRLIAINQRCNRLIKLFGSVGLRQSVHIAQNWEVNQSQADRVAYRYLLPEPRTWDKQFSDEFYFQLERLTKIYLKGSHRPHLWAQLTNEFVYDYLPSEVAEGVRMAKAENATTDKLHQFLSVEGLDLLQKHLNALTILMTGVSSVEELRKVSIGRFAGQYQQALILK